MAGVFDSDTAKASEDSIKWTDNWFTDPIKAQTLVDKGCCKRGSLPLQPKSVLSSRPWLEPAVMGATMDSNSKKSDTSWWKAFEQTSSYMEKLRRGLPEGQHPRRVKVAILDTGIDWEDPLLRKARDYLPEGADIDFKDFVGNSETPVDSSGHGTRVAYFLLQITQNVDLWIARVFEHDEGTNDSPEMVTKLRH
ncbi:hypothetical protein BDZ45DRAFT_457069 [Acephala macrosclerotiorum]|nr:hypothetical protein BDZ45DRAFT_457069 [Acephala macrosclerotiorum]